MDRKNFLGTILPLAASTSVFGVNPTAFTGHDKKQVIPPYLNQGDSIGITCPAGFITAADVEPSITKLKEWGFNVIVGNTVGKRDFTFGGTDEERLADFQSMLDNRNIKAILCARGGYGMVRIIDKIDFSSFITQPKWIIGFSDITVLHSHLQSNYNIASLHSKMCNSFPADWYAAEQTQRDSIESIRQCLTGQKMVYNTVPNAANRQGTATGILVGGNLKTLETLAGTRSNMNTKNSILFVEDTGEYLYSIDRMFWNLKRTGKLAPLKGLIIGGMKTKPDDEGEPFGKTIEAIVMEKLAEYNYPVCFDFPVGHQKSNYALKCGVLHTLEVSAAGGQLKDN